MVQVAVPEISNTVHIHEHDISGALRACGKSRNLDKGKMLHAAAVRSGDISDVHVASSLVDMYAKCGRLVDARRVFDEMTCRDVQAWTALILGYANNGEEQLALELFSCMANENYAPNASTFMAALKACTHLAEKEKGKMIHGRLRKVASLWKGLIVHSHAVARNSHSDMFVASTLVDMYAKCGSIEDAKRSFDNIRNPDVVCWNALIFGYVDNGEGQMALDSYARMKCAPTALTTVAALKACTSLGKQALLKGMTIHSCGVLKTFDADVRVASTLIDMYAKYGCLVDACHVFHGMQHHTVVSWTALMFGYADNGDGETTLKLFALMGLEGCTPNVLTFVAALKACSVLAESEGKNVEGGQLKVGPLEKGMAVHFHAACFGCVADNRVGTTLVDMYSMCGSMADAAHVFERMHCYAVVSWNAMMFGYVENGGGEMALELFSRMEREACEPDVLTFVAALKACGMVGALEFGRRIHGDIVLRNLQNEAALVSSLVDFYGRCGSMVEAENVFDSSAKCLVSWTALMTGYSSNGNIQSVLNLFEKMQDLQLPPDGVVFRCVLTACSHAGLVDKGKEYFDSMSTKFGLKPDIEHYHCMLDILGRANHLKEAVSLVKSMPFSANAITWTTLLGACGKWKNVEVGKIAFDALLKIDSNDAGVYLLMARIYQVRGMQQEHSEVEAMRLKMLETSTQVAGETLNQKLYNARDQEPLTESSDEKSNPDF